MARHRLLCWQCVVAAAALSVCVLTAGSAAGQNYTVIKPPLTDKQAAAQSGQVATILRAAEAPSADAKKQLDNFFKGWLFSSMTSTDPLALGQLSEKREQLFQRYINQAKSQGARDYLNAMTLQVMSSIAKGSYHPAVRYNAALIIGQLDAQPGAKALPAATDALLALLENEQFNKLTVPTAVKVAALVSLQRHARLGVDAALGERITKAALAAANREELPEDVSAKAYGWVRRQAAKVLAIQFEKGLTQPVYQVFVRLVSDKTSDLDDRCAVAQLLVPTMFSGAQGLDPEDMTLALGALAREVLDVEAEEARDFIDEMLAGGGFSSGIGSEGRGGFDGESRGGYMGRGGGEGGFGDFGGLALEDQEPKYEKRRMIDRTLAIVAAADAVAAGGSDELKERLGEFSTAIRTVAEEAAPDNATTEDITAAVDTLQKDIDQMVTSWAPAKPAAEKAAEEEGEAAEPPAAEEPAAEAPATAEAPAAAEAPADAAGGN